MKQPPSFAEPADRSGRTPERLRHVSLIAGAMVALLVLAGNAWLQWRHAGQIRETARYVAGTRPGGAIESPAVDVVTRSPPSFRGIRRLLQAHCLAVFSHTAAGMPEYAACPRGMAS